MKEKQYEFSGKCIREFKDKKCILERDPESGYERRYFYDKNGDLIRMTDTSGLILQLN